MTLLSRIQGSIPLPLCPSCGLNRTIVIGDIPSSDNFGGRILDRELPGGRLFGCRSCGLWFRFPCMEKSELDALYRLGQSQNWQHAKESRVDWKIASEIISSRISHGSVLDVGCFDGQFLMMLGSGYNFAGIEMHVEAAKRAQEKGIQILGDDYEVLAKEHRRFNVVVATDVIEHTKDPLTFLKVLANVTAAGGIIIIASGNTDALPWRLMGSQYGYCAIAEHLSFINPRWCRWAADRLGMSIESTVAYCHASASIPSRIASAAKCLLYRFAPNFAARLRSGGLGGLDVGRRPAMASYPPHWSGAVDHFLTVFRKY